MGRSRIQRAPDTMWRINYVTADADPNGVVIPGSEVVDDFGFGPYSSRKTAEARMRLIHKQMAAYNENKPSHSSALVFIGTIQATKCKWEDMP